MVGRPSIYDEAKATRILDAIAGGASLEEACRKLRIKRGTVACWAVRDHEGFRRRYFEAFGARCIIEADQILKIVDEAADTDSMARVQAARTRADMRRWLAGKLLAEFAERTAPLAIPGNVQVSVYLPAKGARDGSDARLIEGQATDCQSEGTDEHTKE